MIETDYVWIKPPRAPPAEDTRAPSWAFPFSYIAPASPALEGVIRKMFPPDRGPTSRIPNSGPAPVMLRVEELFKVRCCGQGGVGRACVGTTLLLPLGAWLLLGT